MSVQLPCGAKASGWHWGADSRYQTSSVQAGASGADKCTLGFFHLCQTLSRNIASQVAVVRNFTDLTICDVCIIKVQIQSGYEVDTS